MAGFSKSVWQGQGIPMQTEPNRVPEIMANFGQGLSRGVERWIKASEEKRERTKRELGFVTAMQKLNDYYGFMDKDEAKKLGFNEWDGMAPMIPKMIEDLKRKDTLGAIGAMTDTKTVPVYGDVTRERPEVRAEMNEMMRRMSAQGPKPEGSMPTDESLRSISGKVQPGPEPHPAFFGTPYDSPWTMPGQMQRTTNAWQRGIANPPVKLPQDNPYIRHMAGLANRAADAQKQIAENDQGLHAELKDAESRLMQTVREKVGEREVPLSASERRAQLSELAKRYPSADPAVLAKAIDGVPMSISDQLALKKSELEDQARTIPGVGQFATVGQADKFRATYNDAQNAVSGLNRLIEIQEMGDKFTNLDVRREAESLARMVRGALRLKLIGPGAVTEYEQRVLEDLVVNPSKIFQNPFGKKSSLQTVLNKIKKATVDEANSYGLKVDESIFGGPAKAGPTVKRYNPSTGKVE